MRRHRFDPVSCVFGVTFLLFAVVLSLQNFDLGASQVRWVAAALLLVVGLVLLFGSRTPTDHREEAEQR